MSIAMKAIVLGLAILLALLAAITATGFLTGFGWSAIGWLGLIALVLVLAAILPISTRGLNSHPGQSPTYAEAVNRYNDARVNPEAPINPLCEPRLLLHGHPTPRVYVLIHGLSNCPYTFIEWAPMLFAAGHNVMVPRMPRNGHKDIATDALRHSSAQELASFCDWCVDIASALGREVVVVGISGGGVLAGWMAQNRPEVTRAVLVAPAFGLAQFGGLPNAFLMRLMLLLPHISVWKDPIRRATGPSRAHSYKRQSTHGTAEYLRLGLAVRRQAGDRKPAAGSIVVVTNQDDNSVDSALTAETAAIWERDGADVSRHVFPRDAHLPHEMIDPTEPGAMPGLVYPTLTALAEPRQVKPDPGDGLAVLSALAR